jgi:hypothetical protein
LRVKLRRKGKMKAFGLFFTGLLFTALFGALHMNLLNDLILQLPDVGIPGTILVQELLWDWIDKGNSITAQFISLAAMLVGLFSIRVKKEQQF